MSSKILMPCRADQCWLGPNGISFEAFACVTVDGESCVSSEF